MKSLACALNSLESPLPPEVIMVDNSPGDGAVEAFVQAAKRTPCILVPQRNLGFAAAQNLGISRTTGQFVLALNPDVRIAPDYVVRLAMALETDEQAGMASGLILCFDEKRIDSAGLGVTRGRFFFDRFRGMESIPNGHSEFMVGPSGSAALYRKRMLEDIRLRGEYFDESFFMYYEDIDLAWRAQLRGWRSLLVPEARAYHARGGSGSINRYSAGLVWRNRYGVLVKNDRISSLRPSHLLPLLLTELFWFLKIIRNPWRWVEILNLIRLLPMWWSKRKLIQKNCRISGRDQTMLFSGTMFEVFWPHHLRFRKP